MYNNHFSSRYGARDDIGWDADGWSVREADHRSGVSRPLRTYADSSVRPVYRSVSRPVSLSDTDDSYDSDRDTPYRPRLQSNLAPEPLLNPFSFRPRSPALSDLDFSLDEVALLHAAGLRREERRRLATRPDDELRFVLRNAGSLSSHRFSAVQILAAARLPAYRRDFLVREAACLRRIGFNAGEMIDLADMGFARREFILRHGHRLDAIGFTPLEMMLLSMRPPPERDYVIIHGLRLRSEGFRPMEIRLQARDPISHLPAPTTGLHRHAERIVSNGGRHAGDRVRPGEQWRQESTRHSASGVDVPTGRAPSSGSAGGPVPYPARRVSSLRDGDVHLQALSDTEQIAFVSMGLAQEALDRLSLSPETARLYMLEYGGDLLASGMSFDEVIGMAEDLGAPQVPPVTPWEPPGRAHSPPGHVRRPPLSPAFSSSSLSDMFSYLSADDIAGDRSLAGIAQETQAPAAIVQPRNNAQLAQEEHDMLAHAHRRWADGGTSREQGEGFYRDSVPEALTRKLVGGRHPDLLLLLGGVAYAEDNLHHDTAPAHLARVCTLTGYLVRADDAGLLGKCNAAAAEGVTHCGDRVAYGLTRVEQEVLQHKIDRGELPPRSLIESIQRLFLQPRIENIAAYLANARKIREEQRIDTRAYTPQRFSEHVEEAASATFRRDAGAHARGGFLGLLTRMTGRGAARSAQATPDRAARESLEMYAALTPLLAERGVALVESARTSTYGGMYRPDTLEIGYALDQVNRHVRDLSEEYLQQFDGNSAVEKLLRQCFQDDFRSMRTEREALQEQADEAMFDAGAPAGTQATVREVMNALGEMEKQWYRDKIAIVLRRPALLDGMPPMASDLEQE